MERLQKFIAACGIASRRSAEKLINEGRISVNGEIVKTQGVNVDPAEDIVRFDGKIIKTSEEKIYIMLYKPKGYISTVKDEKNRKTVMDLIGDVSCRVFPVGRLDNSTEGLLLLTNDGDWTQSLLHPKFKIEKTYTAAIAGRLSSEKLGKLRHGVKLSDGMTAPAKVEIIGRDEAADRSKIQITIHEGRNRQIRRMFEAVGHEVVALKRTKFAGLSLRGLKRGKYRLLQQEELTRLSDIIAGRQS